MSVEEKIIEEFMKFRKDFSSVVFDIAVRAENHEVKYSSSNIGFVIDGEVVPAHYHYHEHDIDAFHAILRPHLKYLQKNDIRHISANQG